MDLLDRLKEQGEHPSDGHGELHRQAAAEIERLSVKVEMLISTLDQGIHVVETLAVDQTTNNKVEDFLTAAQSLLDEHAPHTKPERETDWDHRSVNTPLNFFKPRS